MGVETTPPQIDADDFARRFSLRAKNLMWLLGAGASASSGIPTAQDMVWEFKQRLFVTQRRVAYQTVADLSNPAVRHQLQAHIDSFEQSPSLGGPDEYAALFEAVFPREEDRRTYLDAKVKGAQASYGHIALATLLRAQFARLVWTTNFDALIADACAKVYGTTGSLTTAALDTPNLAETAISEERWPIEVKLHGDFRSRRLKNTSDELRHQDTQLRKTFVDACRRFGLIVVGYSGRDDSIMDALDSALESVGGFPAGLFWLHRADIAPPARVERLLSRAAATGIDAAMVRIDNFDEVLRDLMRVVGDIDTTTLDAYASGRQRWSGAPQPTGKRGWPVVRLNALPVTHSPSVCRRIVCGIGGYTAVREAVAHAAVNVLVARTSAGVLAYGSDSDVRAAFQAYGIRDFDLHAVEAKRLRYGSGERGLLRDALTRAVTRERGLHVIRRRSSDLLYPADPQDDAWTPLRQIVGPLSGVVEGQSALKWYEGVGTRLDWASDQLWLLVDPRTVFIGISDDNKAAAAEFARERSVKRYNRQLNDLIAFWAKRLSNDESDLQALGISDGVDALFRLSPTTGFSRRCRL